MHELATIISKPNAESNLFKRLEQEVQQKVGAKLVTLMWLDFEAGRARRIYTNRQIFIPPTIANQSTRTHGMST